MRDNESGSSKILIEEIEKNENRFVQRLSIGSEWLCGRIVQIVPNGAVGNNGSNGKYGK
jgi:hypothetical protein